MPSEVDGIKIKTVHDNVELLTQNLINIKDETGEYHVIDDEGNHIDTKSWNGTWEWTHGIGLYGIWGYYQLTNNQKYWKLLEDWFELQLKNGGVSKNINTMAVFLSLAYMYELNGDARYKAYLDSWAEWAMHGLPRTRHGGMQHITYVEENKNQLWDDTLMMTVMPLTKIGLVLNRPQYVEEAKKQFLIHIQYLSDRKTGLFFHGFTFENNGNFAEALWARGNSWITIVIPEFLELLNLPEGDGYRQFLVEAFEAQVAALAKYQNESGMWHTLIDDPTSYVESSATAGFAYGILKGIRLRIISKEKYLPVALKAIHAVIANVDEKGELLNTSFGTPMGHTKQFYKDIPITSMPYGQAMGILALVEFLRLYL